MADFDKKVATKYGILLPDGYPLRALFLIDPTGTYVRTYVTLRTKLILSMVK